MAGNEPPCSSNRTVGEIMKGESEAEKSNRKQRSTSGGDSRGNKTHSTSTPTAGVDDDVDDEEEEVDDASGRTVESTKLPEPNLGM